MSLNYIQTAEKLWKYPILEDERSAVFLYGLSSTRFTKTEAFFPLSDVTQKPGNHTHFPYME